MKIDAKQTVLFAVYAEYMKDLPDMPSLTFETLGMDWRVFNIAFLKLQNEGLIDGLNTVPPYTRMLPQAVILDGVMPTRAGIDYVERKLEIDRMGANQEKLAQLKEKFGKLGWGVLQGVVINILTKFF